MPAPGSKLVHGKRYNPLNRELYKKFIKETCINIDFKTFVNIIRHTNEVMRKAVVEEEAGIKLPQSLGTIIVTKYKSNRVPWDWKATMEHNMKVPLLNLHSFGYIHHIKWFKMGVKCANNFIYKFQPYRMLKRDVAKSIKEGKKYFKWENSDLWSTTKMDRRFEKFYNKDKS
jgi:hypothetical protein